MSHSSWNSGPRYAERMIARDPHLGVVPPAARRGAEQPDASPAVDDGTAHRGPVRVGAVDDHPAILSGLLAGLSQPPRTFVCAVAETVAELLDFGAAMDIVLLDLRLADDSDPETNVHTLIEHGLPVLLYTQERRQPLVARALQAGASGVVGKHEPMSTLAQAVSRVVDGGVWFSAEWAEAIRSGIGPELAPRETEAITLYAAGLPLKSVATRMGLSQETVKQYLNRCRAKYAAVGRPAQTKTELYRRAIEDGYLEAP